MDKTNNSEIWIQLGKELKVLDALIGDIYCDKDYQGILTKKETGPLSQAKNRITKARCLCDEHMSYKANLSDIQRLTNDENWGHVFYGTASREISSSVEKIRAISKGKTDVKALTVKVSVMDMEPMKAILECNVEILNDDRVPQEYRTELMQLMGIH